MKASRYRVAGAAFAALLLALVLATGASATPSPSELVIPAGDVATLSGATFGDQIVNPGNCPSNTLAYSYQLNAGTPVQLASQAGCGSVSNTTIGPVSTPTQLRIVLGDISCGDTFYSDGNHALVTPLSASSWSVSIMDADVGCPSGTGVARVPVGAGTGNLNVIVTFTPASPSAVCATTRTWVTGSAAYATGQFLSRGYAGMLTVAACFTIDQVTVSASPRNAALIAEYEGLVTRLVQGGWLTSTQGAALDAAASAL